MTARSIETSGGRARGIVAITTLAVMVLALPGQALAQTGGVEPEIEPAPAAEPVVEETVAPAAQPTEVALDASVGESGSRAWLSQRSPKSAMKEPSTGMGWRTALLILFLVALGGGALYLRTHRPASVKKRIKHLEIVDTASVGPKAQAVVARVGGRLLLLGVTESNVQRLAWLDEEQEGEGDNVIDFESRALARRGASVPARAELEQASLEARPRRFRDILRSVIQREPEIGAPERPEEDAAVLLASEMQDVIKPRAARTVIDIEQQAAGLAARLRERRSIGGPR